MESLQPMLTAHSRAVKRAFICISAFILCTSTILFVFPNAPREYRQRITNALTAASKTAASKTSPIPQCGRFIGSNDIWEASQLKYQHLLDEKFTIALQTYQRPKELNDTLQALLSQQIPSLLEVVVVWNDLETAPPADYVTDHGVRVRYRQSEANSLNAKLWPDPEYRTQAIFLSDDDIYYQPEDLEFVFQTWRKFGRRKLTGGFARCAVPGSNGEWQYSTCSNDRRNDNYNLILSGLAFSHISFLDYYSSHDEVPTKIRAYVDEHFNCEDLALNYMVSLLTGEGPLLVRGRDAYVSYVPATGVSTRPGHLAARSQCLNDYVELFGCMPLINETARVERGVIIS